MRRTSSDGSTYGLLAEGYTNFNFTMGNISLGYELDSMSNIGATFGLTGHTMKNEDILRQPSQVEPMELVSRMAIR